MNRRELKKKARQNLKKHYWLLLVLCLFAAFVGIEYGSSFLHMNASAAEETESTQASSSLMGSWETILIDVITGDNDAAAQQVEQNQETILENDTSQVLGRSRGVLSALLNSFTSGGFLLSVIDGIHSIGISENIAIAFLVVLGLMLYLFVCLFLKETYRIVSRRMILEGRTYEKVPIQRFLYPVQTKKWGRMAWNMFVMEIYQVLWSITVIGGIIKNYSYFLVPYIIAENPSIKANQAITLSRHMMKGYKWKCFVAGVSFWGWGILNLLTFGLSGIFYSNPYKAAFYCEFYVHVRGDAKERNLPGTELLSDTYLYEKAEEDTLRSQYADVIETMYVPEGDGTLPRGISGFLSKWFGIMLTFSPAIVAYEDREAKLQQGQLIREILAGQSYPGRLAPAAMKYRIGTTSNLRATRSYTLLHLVMLFLIFSFIGWTWEVTLHLISDGVFVNRGVLHGPWLPIYGSGGVLILVLLKRLRKKPVVEFVAAVILCGCVEYFSSWYLELAHDGQKWWDYTGYFLNLHGRICAEGLMVFGLSGLAIVYLLAPAISNLLNKVPQKGLTLLGVVLLVCYLGDQTYSLQHPNTGKGITDYDQQTAAVHWAQPAAAPSATDQDKI